KSVPINAMKTVATIAPAERVSASDACQRRSGRSTTTSTQYRPGGRSGSVTATWTRPAASVAMRANTTRPSPTSHTRPGVAGQNPIPVTVTRAPPGAAPGSGTLAGDTRTWGTAAVAPGT